MKHSFHIDQPLSQCIVMLFIQVTQIRKQNINFFSLLIPNPPTSFKNFTFYLHNFNFSLSLLHHPILLHQDLTTGPLKVSHSHYCPIQSDKREASCLQSAHLFTALPSLFYSDQTPSPAVLFLLKTLPQLLKASCIYILFVFSAAANWPFQDGRTCSYHRVLVQPVNFIRRTLFPLLNLLNS